MYSFISIETNLIMNRNVITHVFFNIFLFQNIYVIVYKIKKNQI